jgi:hypothetical protein
MTGDERLMPETSVPTPPGFDALSKAEQVRYLQALWDQISQDPGTLPVSESHLRLAEERLKTLPRRSVPRTLRFPGT